MMGGGALGGMRCADFMAMIIICVVMMVSLVMAHASPGGAPDGRYYAYHAGGLQAARMSGGTNGAKPSSSCDRRISRGCSM